MEETTPTSPHTSPPAPVGPTPPAAGKGFQWDEQKKNICIWSLVASIAAAYIETIGSYLGAKYFVSSALGVFDPTGTLGGIVENMTPPVAFNFTGPLKSGIVSGVVTAVILMFFYRQIFAWVQKQFFGKYVNTFFKILFYPYLIAGLIFLFLGSLFSLKATLVMLVFITAARFVFAKILDMKVGEYFA